MVDKNINVLIRGPIISYNCLEILVIEVSFIVVTIYLSSISNFSSLKYPLKKSFSCSISSFKNSFFTKAERLDDLLYISTIL